MMGRGHPGSVRVRQRGFDLTLAYGGPIPYVFEDAVTALSELLSGPIRSAGPRLGHVHGGRLPQPPQSRKTSPAMETR